MFISAITTVVLQITTQISRHTVAIATLELIGGTGRWRKNTAMSGGRGESHMSKWLQWFLWHSRPQLCSSLLSPQSSSSSHLNMGRIHCLFAHWNWSPLQLTLRSAVEDISQSISQLINQIISFDLHLEVDQANSDKMHVYQGIHQFFGKKTTWVWFVHQNIWFHISELIQLIGNFLLLIIQLLRIMSIAPIVKSH